MLFKFKNFIVSLRSPIKISKKYQPQAMHFMNLLDGSCVFESISPVSDVTSKDIRLCKLEYSKRKNTLSIYCTRPGMLIGRRGENIKRLQAAMDCKLHIVECSPSKPYTLEY